MHASCGQTITITLTTLDQTRCLGNVIGRYLPDHAVVLFFGEMATGKTTLIKAVCEGLGIAPEIVISPTYTLTNIYAGRLPVYHVDLYRMEGPEELDFMDPADWLNPSGPTLIEWPEVTHYYLKDMETLTVRLSVLDRKPEQRVFRFTSSHNSYQKLLTHLTRIDLK
jgi:tRNA threonylcarbamoyladenosine biosynthesis protein TsaE